MESVKGYCPRNLTTVLCIGGGVMEDAKDEKIFPSLYQAEQYALQLKEQHGDIGGWVSHMNVPPDDSFLINDHLDIKIEIRPRRVLWPDKELR